MPNLYNNIAAPHQSYFLKHDPASNTWLPYADVAAANAAIPTGARFIGLLCMVGTALHIYKDGTANSNLVPLVPTAHLQGGNNYGAIGVIGSLDNQPLRVITNNVHRWTFAKEFAALNSTGNNTFINAGSVTTGGGCVAIGTALNSALASLPNSGDNGGHVAIGDKALQAYTTGYFNTVIGWRAVPTMTTGDNNTAIGVEVMKFATNAGRNVAIGAQALGADDYSVFDTSRVQNFVGVANVAIGHEALKHMRSGDSNVAVGPGALQYFISGSQNIAIGGSALASSNSFGNIAIGQGNSQQLTTGNRNTCIGVTNPATDRSFAQGAAAENVIIGYSAGGEGVTGNYNTVIGSSTGNNISGQRISGSGNILLGAYIGMITGGIANGIYIGNKIGHVTANGNAQLNIGNLIFGTNVKPVGDAQDSTARAGRVSIGIETPHSTAILDLTATDKGLLTPRLTTAQRNAIASPAEGLIIFNTETKRLNIYETSAWRNVGSGNWVDISLTSTIVGWSAFTTRTIRVMNMGNLMFVMAIIEGTSNSGTTSFTVPVNNAGASMIVALTALQPAHCIGRASLSVANNVVTMQQFTGTNTLADFNSTGAKSIRVSFFYEI